MSRAIARSAAPDIPDTRRADRKSVCAASVDCSLRKDFIFDGEEGVYFVKASKVTEYAGENRPRRFVGIRLGKAHARRSCIHLTGHAPKNGESVAEIVPVSGPIVNLLGKCKRCARKRCSI